MDNRKIEEIRENETKLIDEIKQLEKENQKYKEKIDKAIDKIYSWGETLNPIFQKEILDILKEVE